MSGEILQWDEEFEVAEEFAGALEQLNESLAGNGGSNRCLQLSSVQGLSPEEKQELQRLLQGGSASTNSDQIDPKIVYNLALFCNEILFWNRMLWRQKTTKPNHA